MNKQTIFVLAIVTAILTITFIFNTNKEGFEGNFWAPTLPEDRGAGRLVGATSGTDERELNAHDFEASLDRKIDSNGNPTNTWYQTKDVSNVQQPILDKKDWDYLQGGDYYEYWYNKRAPGAEGAFQNWMTYKDYNKIAEANTPDRFPKIYCNKGWYSGNTCEGVKKANGPDGYEGTYLFGEANSVGNRITPPEYDDEDEDMEYEGQKEQQIPSGVTTTGYPGLLKGH